MKNLQEPTHPPTQPLSQELLFWSHCPPSTQQHRTHCPGMLKSESASGKSNVWGCYTELQYFYIQFHMPHIVLDDEEGILKTECPD